MLAKRARPAPRKRNVFAATFAKFRPAGRPGEARRNTKRLPLFARLAPRERPPAPDPVSLAVFAIDQVGPAAVRACAYGVEVHIAAADEATAAVVRAALAETARHRPTDRLIRVVIDSDSR
jgi:hypothetical protein